MNKTHSKPNHLAILVQPFLDLIFSGEKTIETNTIKYYNGISIFKNVSCSIPDGEHIVIVGLNGARKSTLLNIVLAQHSFT